MKRKFNLQMYAETETQATETAGTADKAADNAADSKATAEPEKKYSDADVDLIVKQKLARAAKEQQKAVDEAKRLAEMNATEKAEFERDKLQKELDEYKRKDTLAEMSKTARKMLSDDNITVSDELLSIMVTTDADETKAAVNSFKKLFKDAVDAEVKNRIRGNTPTTGTGGSATLSEIDKRLKKYKK